MVRFNTFIVVLFYCLGWSACAQLKGVNYIKENYIKWERMIPMRDGKKLFTAIYIPKDTSINYPILMTRTPYSCSPYGVNAYNSKLGPNEKYAYQKFIFVYQDVRGRYMSEGEFKEMTPAIDDKKTNLDVDESSDTYDAVDWLIKNIPHNNGNVGIYGISYPGFYASASLLNAHPAIKAVSPQAPVTDEFEGDDAYHRGAFFLMDNFSFMNYFDHKRPYPWQKYPPVSSAVSIKDVFDFYKKTGVLKNFNLQYFHDSSKIWNEYLLHDTKDEYWLARNIRPHLKNIHPAVLVVGGWFDAEDMFGALKTYEAIEKQNSKNDCRLVMGPWTHGAWELSNWSNFADYKFGSNTNNYLQQIELDFFNYYLKNTNGFDAAKASIFITGSNKWKGFNQWPPKEITVDTWYLQSGHQLTEKQNSDNGYDEYISNPSDPVPYYNKKSEDRLNEYIAADQTFASKRKDVLYYESKPLESDETFTGDILASLNVSISGTDADFIVKLIDVTPDDAVQKLVRAEVLRGKFRNSFEKPEPFDPDKITKINLSLNDIAHTFLKGHKIMVQIQSSWFPLVDLNPQKFMKIPLANSTDFQKETIRIYYGSNIKLKRLQSNDNYLKN